MCLVRGRDLLRMNNGDLSKLSPAKLLWAIAGVESSFGERSNPRHESGYCYGGRYYDAELSAAWGCLAHCSYGPWQVMFPHFPKGVTPFGLLPQGDGSVAADLCLQAAIGVLNPAIARGASNLVDIATAYNGPLNADAYARLLAQNSERPMPQYTDPVLA